MTCFRKTLLYPGTVISFPTTDIPVPSPEFYLDTALTENVAVATSNEHIPLETGHCSTPCSSLVKNTGTNLISVINNRVKVLQPPPLKLITEIHGADILTPASPSSRFEVNTLSEVTSPNEVAAVQLGLQRRFGPGACFSGCRTGVTLEGGSTTQVVGIETPAKKKRLLLVGNTTVTIYYYYFCLLYNYTIKFI